MRSWRTAIPKNDIDFISLAARVLHHGFAETRRANVEFARFEMRSRKYPTSAAAEEANWRTQDVIENAVQLVPLRTAAKASRPVGGGAPGKCSRCFFSTLSASESPDAFRHPCLLRAEPRSAAERRARDDSGGSNTLARKKPTVAFTLRDLNGTPFFISIVTSRVSPRPVPLRFMAEPASGWRDASSCIFGLYLMGFI